MSRTACYCTIAQNCALEHFVCFSHHDQGNGWTDGRLVRNHMVGVLGACLAGVTAFCEH